MTDQAKRWLADARARLPERDPEPDKGQPGRRRTSLRKLLAEKAKRKSRGQ